MPDKYELLTQYTPAFLTSASAFSVVFYFLSRIDGGFWGSVYSQAAAGTTMSAALYFMMAYLCRHTGKWIEDRRFGKGAFFPTTNYLLEEDSTFSQEKKRALYDKIRIDFGMNLTDRNEDTLANRKFINELTGKIRRQFFKKNELLTQRNIQYGFVRNLTGGSLIASLLALLTAVISWFFGQGVGLQTSIVLLVVYTALSIFGWFAIRANAERYAETLFEEYLGTK